MFFDLYIILMFKRFLIILSLLASAIQLAFPQCEIKAGDYYVIQYSNRHEEKEEDEDDLNRPWWSYKIPKCPYDIYDIRIVSFDGQMNCIKTHIHIAYWRGKWAPIIDTFRGETICVDDSTIAYTSNLLIYEQDDLTRTLLRCSRPYDIMGKLEEEFVLRSSTIRMGNTLIMYKLDDLHLKRSHYRELKRILKLCGLQLKNNIIIYPN